MKKLFLILCLALPFAVLAQNAKEKNYLKTYEELKAQHKQVDQPLNAPGTVITRPPQIYRMWPDNMPCVVTDMASVKPMPNGLKPDTKLPEMPNGFKRQKSDADGKRN
jgi:hypothetical protein